MMKDLEKELFEANEQIKALKTNLSYYKACFEVMQAACTPAIDDYDLEFALNFTRDNKLGGNANDCYLLAGEFLEEAVNDFYKESKIYIDQSKTLEEQAEFRYLFGKRGLMESIGAKILKRASCFLKEQGFSHISLESICFEAECDSLLMSNVEEAQALLKESLKKLDFNKLDIEAEKNPFDDYSDYFCFKCLVKLINETKEYNNDSK